jgi:hypothetical protein
MSEQAPAPQETPEVAGPEGTPGPAEPTQQEIDYRKRYDDLHPEYTRVTQEAAQLRQRQELYDLMISSEDADTRRQAAEQLGYQLDDDEPDPNVYADPVEELRQRQERLEQALSQRDQQAQEAQYAAQVRAVVDERLSHMDGLDKADQDWVLAYAINALPPTQEGLPDLDQAHQVFQARELKRQKAWAQSKRAPRISPVGQAATGQPNLNEMTDQQILDWQTNRLAELNADD